MATHPIHQQISTEFVSFYMFQTEVMMLASVLVWCLIGTLVWLECYWEQKPLRLTAFFVTLLCGPCAWIISAWTVAHQRRVVITRKVIVSEAWPMPGRN